MPPRIIHPQGAGLFVLVCDHASHWVPPELDDLGLAGDDLTRHIAWDIGAADVTRWLSDLLDAPAVLSTASRLVVDCNRHLDAPALIPEVSDQTVIPGNLNLSPEGRAARIEQWYAPYHDAIEIVLTERLQRRVPTVVVSVHSMTASLAGSPRPWPIAISSNQDRSWAEPLLAWLRQPGDIIPGDNQPYDLDPAVDYTIPFHALRRGLPQVQVEFRQDVVADSGGQESWARRFAEALSACAPRIVLC